MIIVKILSLFSPKPIVMMFAVDLWVLNFWGCEEPRCCHYMECCLFFISLWCSHASSLEHWKCWINNLELFTQYFFWLAFKDFDTCLADRFCISNWSWIVNQTFFLDILSVLTDILIEICWLAKVRSGTWLTISEVDTAESLSDCASSLALKSSCWKLAYHFFTDEYDGHLSNNFYIIHSWISFGVFFCENRIFRIAYYLKIPHFPVLLNIPFLSATNDWNIAIYLLYCKNLLFIDIL